MEEVHLPGEKMRVNEAVAPFSKKEVIGSSWAAVVALPLSFPLLPFFFLLSKRERGKEREGEGRRGKGEGRRGKEGEGSPTQPLLEGKQTVANASISVNKET